MFFIYSGIMSSLSPYMVLLLIVLSLISLFGTRQAQSYEYKQKDLTAAYEKSCPMLSVREAMQRSERTCGSIMQEAGFRSCAAA